MYCRVALAIAGFVTFAGWTRSLGAQEADEAEIAFAEFRSVAERYQMTTESGDSFDLLERPIMNWTNPARNNELGSIFIWESEGRPMIVGTVFTYVHSFRGTVCTKHAFHSLSQDPLIAGLDEQTVWRPESPGLLWRTSAGVPDAAARRRLVQMRGLARRFEVQLTDDKNQSEILRLLPQPLHRYAPAGSSGADGAIFAFVTATDPEALLLVESHATETGLKWRYAFARFHFATLEATLEGDPVWSAELEIDQRRNVPGAAEFQGRSYTTMFVGERPAN